MANTDQEDRLAQAQDLETIRLCFVDQHGILRGKTIVASELKRVLEHGMGVPSTLLLKDTSHRTVFPIWSARDATDAPPFSGASDMVLRPDPTLFFRLPWSQHSAILLCDVLDRHGTQIPFSASAVLQRADEALANAGYQACFGLEVEFQVFRVVDAGLSHGNATMPPVPPQTENLTQGHQFLTETRYGEVQDMLDDLRRAAEVMGLEPRTVEIEMGPSQFEFTFAPGDPKSQAARFVLFRTLVKEMCQMRGLHGSFMAKPRLENAAANGWHIHQSVLDARRGSNVFTPTKTDALTRTASGWIAGLLNHASSLCLLTNPTVNSYKRFAPFQLAPNRILWGRDNRGAMIRSLIAKDDPASRVENRIADSSVNPYFAFAGQIFAGLDGLNAGLTAPDPSEAPYDDTADTPPATLGAAIAAFETSEFVARSFGAEFQTYMSTLKRAEWDRYLMTISEWEHQEYFGLF